MSHTFRNFSQTIPFIHFSSFYVKGLKIQRKFLLTDKFRYYYMTPHIVYTPSFCTLLVSCNFRRSSSLRSHNKIPRVAYLIHCVINFYPSLFNFYISVQYIIGHCCILLYMSIFPSKLLLQFIIFISCSSVFFFSLFLHYFLNPVYLLFLVLHNFGLLQSFRSFTFTVFIRLILRFHHGIIHLRILN